LLIAFCQPEQKLKQRTKVEERIPSARIFANLNVIGWASSVCLMINVSKRV